MSDEISTDFELIAVNFENGKSSGCKNVSLIEENSKSYDKGKYLTFKALENYYV